MLTSKRIGQSPQRPVRAASASGVTVERISLRGRTRCRGRSRRRTDGAAAAFAIPDPPRLAFTALPAIGRLQLGMNMSTRGERIRQALTERAVHKQQALAAELNVHESAITRWKEGKPISLDNAVAFGAVLDVSLDWLLLGRGTIDGHRSISAADQVLRHIAGRLSPRALTLLQSFVDAVAEDIR